MRSPRERAKSLLAHYFEICYDGQVDDDMYREIEDIVDQIVEAAKEEIRQGGEADG